MSVFYFQATLILGQNARGHRRRMQSTARSLCTRRRKVNHMGTLAGIVAVWTRMEWTEMLVLIVYYAHLPFALLEEIYSLWSTLYRGKSPPNPEPVVSLLQTTQVQYRASAGDGACG